MSTLVNPRFVLVQSLSNKKMFFYLVLMDLPNDTTAYPDPSAIVPTLKDKDILYHTEGFSLPANYDGETITYLLTPFIIVSEDESIPDIKTITFSAKKTSKKGDTGGVLGKQIYIDPKQQSTRDVITEYSCNGRCFVIQSDTNTTTYFVGTLVDLPTTIIQNGALETKNTNEYQINTIAGSNPNKTIVAYSPTPSTYTPGEEPSADYIAIFVKDHNNSEQKGIYLYNGTNLYASAWQPSYGSNTL